MYTSPVSLGIFPPRPERVTVFYAVSQYAAPEKNVSFPERQADTRHAVRQRWGAATKATMSRTLVWIEQQRFRGFGCSECGWRFKPSGAPTGTSFDELMRNFELQRDKEFTLHVCADHPSAKSTKL